MNTKYLLDAELQPMADNPSIPRLTDDVLKELRKNIGAQRRELGDPNALGIGREEIFVPSESGLVRCLLYKPNNTSDVLSPGYVHVHGGGYLLGSPEGSDANNLHLCANLGITILSVDYRLAPEHPIPAPLDDCYAALAWMHGNALDLRLDPKRIGVGGESAGGGLAAALALRARDEGEYSRCWQQMTYPMLDDRTGDAEHPGDPLVGEFVWTRHSNQFGWDSYLGTAPREAPQVPARAKRLGGLPPTWIFTATLDLFRDENINYAHRLMAAGVACDLVVYAGACHGFQFVEGADISRRYREDFDKALRRGLGCD